MSFPWSSVNLAFSSLSWRKIDEYSDEVQMKLNSQVLWAGIASLAVYISSELLQTIDLWVIIWDGLSVAILRSMIIKISVSLWDTKKKRHGKRRFVVVVIVFCFFFNVFCVCLFLRGRSILHEVNKNLYWLCSQFIMYTLSFFSLYHWYNNNKPPSPILWCGGNKLFIFQTSVNTFKVLDVIS